MIDHRVQRLDVARIHNRRLRQSRCAPRGEVRDLVYPSPRLTHPWPSVSQRAPLLNRSSDNGANGMLARNHWGWDRPGPTMALSVPNANDDIGDDNKIIIELVRAPKRED